MARPLVSVVFASYQRRHLLERSLKCYERQDFDNSRLEIVCIDDHSRDGTRELVLDWSATTKIPAVVLTASPKPGEWVDCGKWLNYGIRAAHGEHVLLTHPEVMPGRRSVTDSVMKLVEFEDFRNRGHDPLLQRGGAQPPPTPLGLYACCKVYYLSPREQGLIDACTWAEDGPLAVRRIPDFYEADTDGHPDFSHKATDGVATPGFRLPHWESFVFGGHSRETWRRLGGMLETQEWGSVDVAWMHRRRTLGIPNHTCPDDDTICVHQNHDLPGDTKTNRDMDRWVKELKSYPLNEAAKLVYPAVDNL